MQGNAKSISEGSISKSLRDLLSLMRPIDRVWQASCNAKGDWLLR